MNLIIEGKFVKKCLGIMACRENKVLVLGGQNYDGYDSYNITCLEHIYDRILKDVIE